MASNDGASGRVAGQTKVTRLKARQYAAWVRVFFCPYGVLGFSPNPYGSEGFAKMGAKSPGSTVRSTPMLPVFIFRSVQERG
ncbi:hypothetical protein AS19_09380 [Alcanivorax sp. NBRC 101098]|nr:hypothetical protein AS19_09380 [Alcanivorax sp. NBRC 101098]